jgi:type IV secretory pathway VirB2 component (pilin)
MMRRYIVIAVIGLVLSGCAMMPGLTQQERIDLWVDSIFYALAECH